jgi:uncharacterized membrane protein YdjX (TVP38/TMEM64 family)
MDANLIIQTKDKRKAKLVKYIIICSTVVISISMYIFYFFIESTKINQFIAYFLFMCIGCTAIPLPCDAYVMALGRTYDPFTVAVVGAFGNLIAAYFEYKFVFWLFSVSKIKHYIKCNRFYKKFEKFFNKSAFLCLIITGFTPIPFEPFRLAAIISRYNIKKYLIAILLSRLPRYYIYALTGTMIPFKDWHIFVIVLVLTLVVVLGVFLNNKNNNET